MKILKSLLIVTFAAIVLLMIYWVVLPNSSPAWTGFGAYDEQVSGPRAKTLWDWMALLIVPVVLAIGAWWLNKSEKDTEREIARQKDITEREIAENRQWQATLEAYFDRMTDLLLREGLRSSQVEEVQTIARTRTLAVLRNLDGIRKGQVICFLYESDLLRQDNPIVNLTDADLTGTNLESANLPEINLSNAQFIKANLSHANLLKATLTGAQFAGSNLRGVNLNGAMMRGADLKQTVLENAQLDEADLVGANLSGANLREASLFKANLHNANLEGADMRDANLHEATLITAKLAGAQLSSWGRTHLRGANLMGATLVGVNLNGVELLDADLRGANLIGATLVDTNLRRANLWEAALGSIDDLKQVKSLDGATLPDGTKYDGRVILSKISQSHVLRAISEDKKRASRFSFESSHSKYALVYKGERYPLDLIIPFAYESEDGLPHDVFDKEEAQKHLTALGFVIESGGL